MPSPRTVKPVIPGVIGELAAVIMFRLSVTEQMESAAKQINQKLPEVQTASKTEAERLGHSVAGMVSFFDPLVNNAIGFASNMVSSKQQVTLYIQ